MYKQGDIDAEVLRLDLVGGHPSTVVNCNAFINGKSVPALSGKTFDSFNPSTGALIARIASCDTDDVNAAVESARASCGAWAALPPRERKDILVKFAALVDDNLLELAVMDAVEAGKPVADNIEGDVPNSSECIRFHAEAIDKLMDTISPTDGNHQALNVREPVGVVALVVPWNFPLNMAAWKIGPALATGNSVILKPAELTSLSAIKLAQLARDSGIPDGVFNVVPGLGAEAGSALSAHMDVDMIGFTGSTTVGRLVLQASALSNLKRVSLELGGKSPQLVFADAEDLDAVASHVMNAAFWNMGENCSCGSRLFVHDSIKDVLVAKLVELSQTRIMGDPLKLETVLGPMITRQHADKVAEFIEKGKREGAKLIVGGSSRGGNFVDITIFEATNNMEIAQEEIFGPVLCVMGFSTEEEAISMANDTKYGLAASVYTSNINTAHRVSRKLKAGNVSINCFSEGDITTPFGGYGQSGFVGRDKSIYAHEQYTELKTIWTEFN